MVSDGPPPAVTGLRARVRRFVAGWSVWEIPRRVLPSVVTVEVTAVVLVLLGILRSAPPTTVELQTFLLVCFIGIAHSEIARDIERMRRRVTGGELHVDLGSVWFFGAAVLLLPAYAAVVTLVVHNYLWVRSVYKRDPMYRQVFNASAMAISTFAASAAMRYATGTDGVVFSGPGLFALMLGMLVFITMNSALVAAAIALSSPEANLAQMIGKWSDNLLELCTLSMGALVAVAFTVNPWLVLFVLPPLLVLHRAVLVSQLKEAASTDGKTGLLNAATWHARAERELKRVPRNAGHQAVLVLDLDHFKTVNDTHGHIAGDHVLAAVADSLRAEVRDRDLVGRFGGEEFVVLLAGSHGGDDTDLEAVADRIRRRVAALRVEIPTADGPLTIAGLSISVGGAVHSGGPADLRELLQIADTALYSAKRAGRNMVRMGSTRGSHPAVPVLRPVSDAPASVADAQ